MMMQCKLKEELFSFVFIRCQLKANEHSMCKHTTHRRTSMFLAAVCAVSLATLSSFTSTPTCAQCF
jgi:hypothetical protein